jgi:CHAT domain-containing protein
MAPDDSTALVEFVTGRRGQPTTVFVTTRAGLRAHVVSPIDSVGRSIESFLAGLRDGRPVRESGERIRSALLDPVLATLPTKIGRLVIVPDDVLHQLPFDALPQRDGSPLVERFEVALAPSAAVAARLQARQRSTAAVRILALGDPDVPGGAAPRGDAGDTYRSAFADAGGLERLPAAGAEARLAARFARGSVVRLGASASETFFKSAALDSFRVVHLATHALVSDWSPARTALALAPGGGEDGFLGPGDLMGLRIPADVVVLSGCRTAGGVVLGGEGVRGLTAPLLEAGARSVVATLWEVRDRGAARMVEGIYRSLAAGRPLSAAVREAKLEAIRQGARPEEWAAFVLVGDPDVTLPLQLPRRAAPLYASGAVVAALCLLAAYRMRKRPTAETRSPSTRVSTIHS